MEKAYIYYGKEKIDFRVFRREIKNINLKVTPDADVIVTANDSVNIEYIKEFIIKKAGWIIKNVRYFNEYRPRAVERKYESGESFKYLGKQYRLKVIQDNDAGVKLMNGYILLNAVDINNAEHKRALLDNWYKEKAGIKFKEIFDKLYPLLQKYDVDRPELVIRKMKTKWGSYSSKKNEIALNTDVVKAPKYCIEYVMLHELIHLKYRNHDNKFYYFLTVLMPDWKKRKEILDQEIAREL